MHLSDEQLLAPDKCNHFHLKQCQQCNVRYQHLTSIRGQIKQVVSSSDDMPNFNQDISWLQLKSSLEDAKGLTKTSPFIKVINVERTNFWRNCTVALAASLLLMVFIGFDNLSSSQHGLDSQHELLTQLINENNQLQKQVLNLNSANNQTKAQLALVSATIQQHDLSLQQAYLVNKADDEKIKLWQQRKDILKRATSSRKQTQISI